MSSHTHTHTQRNWPSIRFSSWRTHTQQQKYEKYSMPSKRCCPLNGRILPPPPPTHTFSYHVNCNLTTAPSTNTQKWDSVEKFTRNRTHNSKATEFTTNQQNSQQQSNRTHNNKATELTTTKKKTEPHTSKANTSLPCRRILWWSCFWLAPGSPPGCPPQWWRHAAGHPFSPWTPQGWAASHCQTPGLQRWSSSPERIETCEIRVFYHLPAGSQVEMTVNMFECKWEGKQKVWNSVSQFAGWQSRRKDSYYV